MAKGKHPVPFRTRKLSSSAPMVLRGGPRGRVGRRRTYFRWGRPCLGGGPNVFVLAIWLLAELGGRQWQRSGARRATAGPPGRASQGGPRGVRRAIPFRAGN